MIKTIVLIKQINSRKLIRKWYYKNCIEKQWNSQQSNRKLSI